MDKLIVKNFGPIKDISIDVNDINIFIGPTSSGKSTVAKLIAIFRSIDFLSDSSYSKFSKCLSEFNIDFEITDKTEIDFSDSNYSWKIREKKFFTDNPYEDEISTLNIVNAFENKEIERMSVANFLLHFPPLFDIKQKYPANFPSVTSTNFIDAVKKNELNVFAEDLERFFNEIKSKIGIYNSVYIPAERLLLSMVGESLFGLMKNDVSIAESLKNFGSMFETARKKIKSFDVNFLNAKYEYTDKNNYLTLSDGTKVKLEIASSGFQSIVPLMIVIENASVSKGSIDNCFIVEEPESNLYPTMQKSLIEFIISKVNLSGDRLIITTHSPYTLTSIDNLIQAKSAFEKHPELKDEISKVVPESLWLDFNKVSCYYFEDGYCRSTMDIEMQSIGPSNIDDVSIELGKTFDQLLDLKYRE